MLFGSLKVEIQILSHQLPFSGRIHTFSSSFTKLEFLFALGSWLFDPFLFRIAKNDKEQPIITSSDIFGSKTAFSFSPLINLSKILPRKVNKCQAISHTWVSYSTLSSMFNIDICKLAQSKRNAISYEAMVDSQHCLQIFYPDIDLLFMSHSPRSAERIMRKRLSEGFPSQQCLWLQCKSYFVMRGTILAATDQQHQTRRFLS